MKKFFSLSWALTVLSSTALAQSRPVTGRVTTSSGGPAAGATVTVKGTSNSVVADADGRFSINASRGNVLVVSYTGYGNREIPVGTGMADVQLAEQANDLNDVVVVGYGTQRRKDIAGSVASISAKDFKDMPISNLGQALQGRMAGVVVQQASGAPGSSPAIRVRGLGSITASSAPLLVVDQQILGNLGDFSFINPNDIERIDVLKDASATAIYGARGSNGVVLITTKRGRSGTPRVNVDAYTGFQQVTKKVGVLNTAQFVELAKEAYANARAQLTNPPTQPAFLTGPLEDVDYQDLIFRNAPMNSFQASATGGSDKVSYLLSANYLGQDGIIHTSNFKRFSLRANVDAQLSNRIKVGVSVNPTFNDEKLVQSDGHWQNFGIINAALSTLPFVSVYRPDGVTYNSQVQYQQINAFYGGITNPVANIYAINDRQKTMRFLSNVYGELDIVSGLKYRASFGADVQQIRRNLFQSSALPQNGIPAPQLPNRVAGFFRSTQNVNWLFNQTLNYVKSFESGHNLNVLVGTEAQKNNREGAAILANNFPNDVVQTVNAGTIVPTFAGFPPQLPLSVGGALGNSTTVNTFFGYFARLGYNFRQKYFVDLSVRRDASSRFAPQGRWATFPAGALAWVVSEEDFLKDNKLVSNLKLKASFGLSGNAAIGNDYASYGVLTAGNYNFNQGLALGLRPQNPDNNLLTWEKSQQLDAGMELGLWKNRVLLTADYYTRTTSDLLLFTAVPSISGFTNVLQNIGKLKNYGMEFGLNAEVVRSSKFRWSTQANVSFNRSEVLALGPTGDPVFSNVPGIVGNATRSTIGGPLAMYYGYQQVGIFQSQDEIDKYAQYPAANRPRPGDRKFADVNGDGFINANDQTDLGNSQPKFVWGLTNTLSYAGIDLSVLLQGVQGQSVFNFSRRFYAAAMSPANNLLSEAMGRWQSPTNPGDGKTPRMFIGNSGLNNQANSTWVEDASYVNIRNVSLGYTLPASLLSRASIRSARIYGSIHNAAIFTKYTGFNPEASGFESTDPLSIGVDYGGYPLARTLTFGVQLGF